MKVKCNVCGEWFNKDNVYCDHCAAKYGSERSNYDVELFKNMSSSSKREDDKKRQSVSSEKSKKEVKRDEKRTARQEAKTLPNFDTQRDLTPPKKKKSSRGAFRSIILFVVFMNIITGFIREADFDFIDDFFDDTQEEFMEETNGDYASSEVIVAKTPEFPMNPERQYDGDWSFIAENPIGIYTGTLSTSTYLDYESKDLRFQMKSNDYSAEYTNPIYISLSNNEENTTYFFDIWDQNTLKLLGSYELTNSPFNSDNKSLTGEPIHAFYDDETTTDLKGSYDDHQISGRIALPYTISNETYYFEFHATKINDDVDLLLYDSYFENEFYESFISDDEVVSLDVYTYEKAQGYPHSSMYYDGVLVLSDNDDFYPPVPFYIEEDHLFTTVDSIDTEQLILKDTDFNNYLYYDDVDTQLYKFYPRYQGESNYTLSIDAYIISENDELFLKGTYDIYNRNDGYEPISKDFSVKYVE